MSTHLIASLSILVKGDAIVEGLSAVMALWQEMEADTTNVLLGTEVLEVIYLVALDFELHHAPATKAHSVAFTQMAVNDFGKADDDSDDFSFAVGMPLRCFFDEFF